MLNESQSFFSPLGTSRLIQIIMNFIPLLGVIFMDWSVFALMYVFWLETLGISFFNSLKILFAQGDDTPGPHIEKAFLFLLFRVLILCFYLVFILVFIGIMVSSKQGLGYEWAKYLLFMETEFRLTIIGFFVIKLLEFIYFYFILNERATARTESYRKVMDTRLIVIHVVLVGGFFAYDYFSQQMGNKMGLIAFAATFVVVKSIAELWSVLLIPKKED